LALAPPSATNQRLIDEAECIIKEAIENFEYSVNKMRELRAKYT
jgi:hypothetical protein